MTIAASIFEILGSSLMAFVLGVLIGVALGYTVWGSSDE